jgi:hypothetical protein
MQHVEKLGIEQAADILEASVVTECIAVAGIKATILTMAGRRVVLIQASSEEFLLVR